MKTEMESIIEIKTEKIMENIDNLSDIDIYNLCVLDRAKEIELKNKKRLSPDKE